MEDLGSYSLFFIAAFFIAFPFFYFLIYEPIRIFIRWVNHQFVLGLDVWQVEYLEKNFQFYHDLSPELKTRFEKRVASFLHNKKITGVEMEVTDEMKLFVAAAAIQLTFGLRNFWLTEFDDIILHKNSYQLADFDYHALGHVSESGRISLSWADLQKGYGNPTDGLNVGLHEMAHALYLSSVQKGWNIDFAVEYDHWEKEAIIEWKKGKGGDEQALRSYGYRNLYELFAVCVEYFFEKPRDLQAAAPKMFSEMAKLLRIDPFNHSDPILHHKPVMFPSQAIPLPEYKPIGLMSHVFTSSRNTFCFFLGSLLWLFGAYIIYSSVKHDFDAPYDPNPLLQSVPLAVALFFIGGFLFIQVFYEDRKSN